MIRRFVSISATAVCLLSGLVVPASPAGASKQYVDGLGYVTHEDGLWRIDLPDGSSTWTHGLDPDGEATATIDPQGTKSSITCVGREKRFEVIYARAFNDDDRSATVVPLLRQAVYNASEFMNSEAKRLSLTSRAKYKVVCDSLGDVIVRSVVLPTSFLSDDASSVFSDLISLGYWDSNVKYLVFYDDCVGLECRSGGVGSINRDDRASHLNSNNSGRDIAIDFGSPTGSNPSWSTILHESGHNMGAVQQSAPHSSGELAIQGPDGSLAFYNGWHCNDGQDIMCYADGGSKSAYNPAVCVTEEFDCNADDYFNPSPSANNYLATHWNIAASYNAFLTHADSTSPKGGPGKKR